jgi:hypothetical protein
MEIYERRFSHDNLMVFHLLAMTVKSVICKALHNLKQALRTWYFKINTYFKPQRLQRSSTDHNLYFLHENEKIVLLVFYVDDLLSIKNHSEKIIWLRGQLLLQAFEMTDLGPMC